MKEAEEYLKGLGREDEYLSAKIYVANEGFKFIKLSQLLTDYHISQLAKKLPSDGVGFCKCPPTRIVYPVTVWVCDKCKRPTGFDSKDINKLKS